MNDFATGVSAALVAGIATIAILITIFPPPTMLLSTEDNPPVTEDAKATLIVTRTPQRAPSIPLEVVENHPDLMRSIQKVNVLYIGTLTCSWRASNSPTEIVSCTPATHSANITFQSAESLIKDRSLGLSKPCFDDGSCMTEYSGIIGLRDDAYYMISIPDPDNRF